MDEAVVDDEYPLETTYHCPRNCGPVLAVSLTGALLWEDGGWRTGDWIIRNVSDLYWQPRGREPLLLLRARIHAFG
jgi:hypothetical protein